MRYGLHIWPVRGGIWHGTLHPAIEDAYGLLKGEKLTLRGYDLWEKEGLKDEEHPLEPYHVTEPKNTETFSPRGQSVKMEGRFIGGCLDILVNLLGTKYDNVQNFIEKYKEEGIIWFLESCDLNVMSIRRALWQMEHAGWFSHVNGFVIRKTSLLWRKCLWAWINNDAVTGILENTECR